MTLHSSAAARLRAQGIQGLPTEWLDRLLDAVRDEYADEAWAWFLVHADDVVFEQRVLWAFWVRVRIRDLRGLFTALFGEPPATYEGGRP